MWNGALCVDVSLDDVIIYAERITVSYRGLVIAAIVFTAWLLPDFLNINSRNGSQEFPLDFFTEVKIDPLDYAKNKSKNTK